MIVDHSLSTWQGIDDRIDAVVEKPRNPFRIRLRTTGEAELLEQRVGHESRGAVEIALFPCDFDPARVGTQAAKVGDVQVVLRGAVEGDPAAGGKDRRVVIRVDARHQQGCDLNRGRVTPG